MGCIISASKTTIYEWKSTPLEDLFTGEIKARFHLCVDKFFNRSTSTKDVKDVKEAVKILVCLEHDFPPVNNSPQEWRHYICDHTKAKVIYYKGCYLESVDTVDTTNDCTLHRGSTLHQGSTILQGSTPSGTKFKLVGVHLPPISNDFKEVKLMKAWTQLKTVCHRCDTFTITAGNFNIPLYPEGIGQLYKDSCQSRHWHPLNVTFDMMNGFQLLSPSSEEATVSTKIRTTNGFSNPDAFIGKKDNQHMNTNHIYVNDEVIRVASITSEKRIPSEKTENESLPSDLVISEFVHQGILYKVGVLSARAVPLKTPLAFDAT